MIIINKLHKSLSNTAGVTVIEIILILLVLVGLVVIFRSQLQSIINDVFEDINEQIKEF